MFRLSVENEKGEELNIKGNENYEVEVEGLFPPDATIGTTSYSTMDGEEFNYSKVGKRIITLTIVPLKDIEKNRINLYRWFNTKKWIRIKYENESRKVYTDGYVETFAGSLHEEKQQYTITIICPEAHLTDAEKVTTSADYEVPMLEFPISIGEEGIEFSTYNKYTDFNIVNDTEIETGMTIFINAFGTVKNPAIYNRKTLENIKLNTEMQNGDTIKVETGKGEKKITLIRGNKESNILNTMDKGMTWLQMKPGDNVFTYEADEGMENMHIQIEFQKKYGGI